MINTPAEQIVAYWETRIDESVLQPMKASKQNTRGLLGKAATTHLGDPWHNPSTAASLWRKALAQFEWMYE